MFLAFLGVSLIVIATPGPDTAMTVRNTLLGGRRGGVLTALGIACGQAIWALATSAGLATMLTASEPLFQTVKYAGAAYLVYLGIHSLRAALAPTPASGAETEPSRRSDGRLPAVTAFRQGVVSDLGNPKMAVFFASLLPQFGSATFWSLLLLGMVFALMTLTWLVAYAFAVARAADFLLRPAVRRTIEGITGTVLIALGLRIAAEHR